MNDQQALKKLVSLIGEQDHVQQGIDFHYEFYQGTAWDIWQLSNLESRLDDIEKQTNAIITKWGNGIYVAALEEYYGA